MIEYYALSVISGQTLWSCSCCHDDRMKRRYLNSEHILFLYFSVQLISSATKLVQKKLVVEDLVSILFCMGNFLGTKNSFCWFNLITACQFTSYGHLPVSDRKCICLNYFIFLQIYKSLRWNQNSHIWKSSRCDRDHCNPTITQDITTTYVFIQRCLNYLIVKIHFRTSTPIFIVNSLLPYHVNEKDRFGPVDLHGIFA